MAGDPAVAPVARALGSALRRIDDVDDETTRGHLARIAGRQNVLGQIPDRVTLTDFGAGDSRVVELGKFYRLSRLDSLSSRILFYLVRELRPAAGIELGTCSGLSAAHQAAALALNGSGRLITIEGDPELARRAAESMRLLGLDRAHVQHGQFGTALPEACAELGSVDYVFNDGHHEEEPTIRYFEVMEPYLAPGATVILDDINWSDGMKRAWRTLGDHPRVEATVDLFRMGILRLRAPESAPESAQRHYRPRLFS